MNEQEQATQVQFTLQQVSDWRAFERVRFSGRFNMFDPRARATAQLDRDSYGFVMKHYSELKDRALQEDA